MTLQNIRLRLCQTLDIFTIGAEGVGVDDEVGLEL